jgi:pimeloyl-ACP methyl ester carboxylesterase
VSLEMQAVQVPKRRSRVRRWTVAIVKWGAILVAMLLLGTTIAGRILHARDDERWKAPGRLVDVGNGRRLHLYCTGSGAPTVVLEAGLGDFSISGWSTVQPQISSIARVCSYDRAGIGWSDPTSAPLLPDQMVGDLHALLAAAGEKPPFVLVGHSLGGPLVRHFAARHRDDVAGLVLVDGSHEEQLKRLPSPKWIGVLFVLLPAMNALGLDRISASPDPADSIAAVIVARSTRSENLDNSIGIFRNLETFLDQIRRDARPFGDLPMVVLSAGAVSPQPGESIEEAERTRKTWLELQKDLAARSKASRWTVVEKSSHYIQRDAPEVVIQAVRAVLDSARARAGDPL